MKSRFPSAVAVVVLAFLVQAASVGAVGFTVTSTADAPDANPGDHVCATADGECTLRAAIMEHNALAESGKNRSNTITVPSGTYTLTIPGRDHLAPDAATGDLDVNGGALRLVGLGPEWPTIDANQLDRIFDLGPGAGGGEGSPVQFSLQRFTLQNGNAASSPPDLRTNGADIGGAIRILKNSGLRVRDALFHHNTAGARGGAFGMPPEAGIMGAPSAGTDPSIITDVKNVTVVNNTAGVEGGGFFNNRVAIVERTVVKDNTVTGRAGNERGGGIAQSGDLTLIDVVVDGNTMAPGIGTGGGISNRGDPVANVLGRLRLERVTVSNNVAHGGGGIASGSQATMHLINTTISGNTATQVGGGIGNAGTATLDFVTLAGNNSGLGASIVTFGPGTPGIPGGAFANGTTSLLATILKPGAGPNCNGPPPPFFRLPVSRGDNIASDNSCGLTGPNDRNGVDPLLGPLADNGGFTFTHALLAGSPAIDAVLNNACPPPATDQRGVARPRDGDGDGTAVCDIGAYEG